MLQECGLDRDVLTSHLDLGPMHLRSRLEAICLGLGPLDLISGLGPLRLIETFCAGARRA